MLTLKCDLEAGAIYIWLIKTQYNISEELAKNVVIDFDKNGRILGIEVLDASKNPGKELVTRILNTEKIAVTT